MGRSHRGFFVTEAVSTRWGNRLTVFLSIDPEPLAENYRPSTHQALHNSSGLIKLVRPGIAQRINADMAT